MKVGVMCEVSGIMRDAFAAKGHDAYSCDLLPSERNGKHIQDDARRHLRGWDLLIAHPPCTRLCNSGVRWLAERNLWREMEEACAFFLEILNAPVPKICVENPIPHCYARERIGRYQQRIQPYEFGHPESKATCLWLKNLPPLFITITETKRTPRCWKERPAKDRSRNRSRTYPNIAAAMAAQWG